MWPLAGALFVSVLCAASQVEKRLTWKSIPFAILKLDDQPPKSWNAYYAEKHTGWILIQLWKRYLLFDWKEQAVYDLDPQKLVARSDVLEWSESDKPDKPIKISDWSERDVGPVRRYRFRFGKSGHVLELQLPLKPNGQPMY